MDKKNYLIIILAFVVNCLVLLSLPFECPWKKALRIDCAGCGVTRMVRSLLELDFYQAFRYNPLFFILLILIIIYICYVLIAILFKKKYYKLNLKWLVGFAIILIVFMVLRNTDYFGYLRPTEIS